MVSTPDAYRKRSCTRTKREHKTILSARSEDSESTYLYEASLRIFC